MTDLLFPPQFTVARSTVRYIDSTGVSRSPFGGMTRTAALLGDRLGITLDLPKMGGKLAKGITARATLQSYIAQMQGQQNRMYCWDHSLTQRGSFSAPELMLNGMFSSGSSSPFNFVADFTGSPVIDSMLRATRIGNTGVSNAIFSQLNATVALGIPYHARVMATAPLYPTTIYIDERSSSGTQVSAGSAASPSEMLRHTFVALGNGGGMGLANTSPNGGLAGDFVMIPYVSLARCALVDISPNLLLQSDDITVTWTNSNSTDTANTTAAPDGTTTADSLIENSAVTTTHGITQTVSVISSAVDISASVCLKAGTRTWAFIQMTENTGPTTVNQYINLGTGALGTAAIGSNWANQRTSVTALGNGWYRFAMVARKTNAATTVTLSIFLATGDVGATYTGNGASLIYVWRPGLSPESTYFEPGSTTSTSNAGSAPTGNSMNLKGLPASTAGLLLPGDQFEVITSRGSELKIVTASLNSDAGGLGAVQFAPRLRGTPSNAAAIIVNRPMGRFVYTGSDMEWANEPGSFVSSRFDFEEST